MKKRFVVPALAGLLLSTPLLAQQQPSGAQRVQGAGDAFRGDPVNVRIVQCTNTAPPVCINGAPRESFKLVASNTPSAPVQLYGGSYIFTQVCASYGTLNLQQLGPDGATYTTQVTKTASDTNGGMGFSIGAFAIVRVTLSGTTGCNAVLARVPA